MKDLHEEFSIGRMAEYFKVSRSGYYRFLARVPSQRDKDDAILGAKIKEIHADHRSVYGIDRLHPALRKFFVCGRQRTRRLMKILGVKGRIRGKFRIMTTNSEHRFPMSPNLLQRNFRAETPNCIWVSDITYIRTCEGWLYLCVIIDLFSRKIVGWSMRQDLTDKLALEALQMAVSRRSPGQGLIFHSDRGIQYATNDFRYELTRHNITQSMSRKGNCLDNACAESIFASIKTEISATVFWSRREARSEIFDYIEVFYNRKRLHSYLGYTNPDDFERRNAA